MIKGDGELAQLQKSQKLQNKEPRTKPYLILCVAVLVSAVLLSAIWHVPYIDTLTAFAGLTFVGRLITVDEELPGGWNNPDGKTPLRWRGLAVKGALVLVLVACEIGVPSLREFGA
jgi:hypothetical protein